MDCCTKHDNNDCRYVGISTHSFNDVNKTATSAGKSHIFAPHSFMVSFLYVAQCYQIRLRPPLSEFALQRRFYYILA